MDYEAEPMMTITEMDIPHGDAVLAMNAEGAQRLHKALDSILRGALPGRRSIQLMPPDGEWFDLHISVQAAEHLPEQKYEWDNARTQQLLELERKVGEMRSKLDELRRWAER